MRDHIVSSFTEYHHLIHDHFPPGWQFRGVPDLQNHALIPSVGRAWPMFQKYGRSKDEFLVEEEIALNVFITESAAFLGRPPENKWQALAIAQHHGLPTRLLDWTHNPLVALYFALAREFDCDAAVYAIQLKYFVHGGLECKYDPFKLAEPAGFAAPHIAPRIRAQSGIFSIQPDPTVPFQHPSMRRIRVKAKARLDIRRTLFHYGVSPRELFPDLDGLASWLKLTKFTEDP